MVYQLYSKEFLNVKYLIEVFDTHTMLQFPHITLKIVHIIYQYLILIIKFNNRCSFVRQFMVKLWTKLKLFDSDT